MLSIAVYPRTRNCPSIGVEPPILEFPDLASVGPPIKRRALYPYAMDGYLVLEPDGALPKACPCQRLATRNPKHRNISQSPQDLNADPSGKPGPRVVEFQGCAFGASGLSSPEPRTPASSSSQLLSPEASALNP